MPPPPESGLTRREAPLQPRHTHQATSPVLRTPVVPPPAPPPWALLPQAPPDPSGADSSLARYSGPRPPRSAAPTRWPDHSPQPLGRERSRARVPGPRLPLCCRCCALLISSFAPAPVHPRNRYPLAENFKAPVSSRTYRPQLVAHLLSISSQKC